MSFPNAERQVLRALEGGATTRAQIWRRVQVDHPQSVNRTLRRLIDQGVVVRVGRGAYQLTERAR